MGIHELMEGTATIKRMIKKQASTEELFEQASKENMTTLKQDGILKVFQGYNRYARGPPRLHHIGPKAKGFDPNRESFRPLYGVTTWREVAYEHRLCANFSVSFRR